MRVKKENYSYCDAYKDLVGSRVKCLFLSPAKLKLSDLKNILDMSDAEKSVHLREHEIVVTGYIEFLCGTYEIKNKKIAASLREEVIKLEKIKNLAPNKENQKYSFAAWARIKTEEDASSGFSLEEMFKTPLFSSVKPVSKKFLRDLMSCSIVWEERDVLALKKLYGPSVLLCLDTYALEGLAGTSLKSDVQSVFSAHMKEKWFAPKDAPTLLSRLELLEAAKPTALKKNHKKSKL